MSFPALLLRDNNAFPLEDIVPQAPFSKSGLFAAVYDHLFLFLLLILERFLTKCPDLLHFLEISLDKKNLCVKIYPTGQGIFYKKVRLGF
ncbi:hypothetical protein DRJ00_04090 [Candidatus Aerophobetes bacterium]|uniref:Uncharacterized protein n=1 Tax=Aerophobetes bacterium TaxID=2030807 RepID=A0A497E3W6_UNCAE|nr:MAG: hypothetical protein DRJ00_04090 [Candidatus Aerophobetes bacterium]